MIQISPVIRILSAMLLIVGGFILSVFPFALYFQEQEYKSFLAAAITVLGVGCLFFFTKKTDTKIRKREGYLIVALGWVALSIAGMLPYLYSGYLTNPADALFESVSGLTTTGASVFTDIESAPKSILLWRSLTQWIGGMGIIVLTVALFPLLGIGGIELFVAEAPGPTSDKLHPRIQETAKRLWFIYLGLTLVLIIILALEGMTVFEAVNHAFTTMATGGFSTRNASAAAYSPLIQYTLILFMFFAGTNYSVIYYALKGNFKEVGKSDEFKAYSVLVLGSTVLVSMGIYFNHSASTIEQSFRDGLFQVVSIITTTGFVSADYSLWHPALVLFLFTLMFVGACAGSTSGGIKIIRNLVFLKNSTLEFKRLLHPKAVIPLKLNGQVVAPRILTHIIIFLLLYLILFILGSIVLAAMNYDFMTAIGAVATCLGNVGPGIGKVGPVDNFAWLNSEAKYLLSFIMLLGRLEIFTILVIFTPFFWRAN